MFRRNPYWVPFWEIMFDAVLRISLSYDIELIYYTNNTLITIKNKEMREIIRLAEMNVTSVMRSAILEWML